MIESSIKTNRYENDVRGFLKSDLSDEDKLKRILLYFCSDFDLAISELALCEQNYLKKSVVNYVKLYGGVLDKVRKL